MQTCHLNISYDNVGSFYHDLICNTLDARSSQNEHPLSFILCKHFLQIFFESHPVLDQTEMLCFPDFTENSNLKLLFQKLNSKSQKILKNSIYPKTPHSRGRTFMWSLKPKWMIVMQASREVFFVSYLNVASNSSLHFIFFHY